MDRDLCLDALADLQHDLGKHLRLPLGFLPRDADPSAVRAALATALRRTRRGPGGEVPAASLWAAFVEQVGAALGHLPEWAELAEAVRRALAWEAELAGAGPLDRAAIERDLGAVGPAIRRLSAAVQGAPQDA